MVYHFLEYKSLPNMEFQAGTSIVAKRATAVVAQTATNASVQNPTDGDGVVVAQGTVDAGV